MKCYSRWCDIGEYQSDVIEKKILYMWHFDNCAVDTPVPVSIRGILQERIVRTQKIKWAIWGAEQMRTQ